MSLTSCWQCELDIPHICYEGIPDARWGMTDEALAALEGAQRHGFMLTPEQQRQRRRDQDLPSAPGLVPVARVSRYQERKPDRAARAAAQQRCTARKKRSTR